MLINLIKSLWEYIFKSISNNRTIKFRIKVHYKSICSIGRRREILFLICIVKFMEIILRVILVIQAQSSKFFKIFFRYIKQK